MNHRQLTPEQRRQSRRVIGLATAVLTGLLALPFGWKDGATLAQTEGTGQSSAGHQASEPKTPIARQLNVLYAGSMTSVMEKQIKPALSRRFGLTMEGEAAGSSELAALIQTGQKRADLFISASPSVIQSHLMGPANHRRATWFLTLAGDCLVITYNPHGRFTRQLNAAKAGRVPWYQVLTEKGFRLGRTDPKLDPKGLYTLVMGVLANRYYHRPALAKTLFGTVENSAQVFPEEDLIARLETGQMDAVIAYRHEAVEWHLPYISLPAAINLGSARYARQYSTPEIRVGGKNESGSLIEFALTIPASAGDASDAVNVAKYLIVGAGHRFLENSGFSTVPVQVGGNRSLVPKPLQPLIQGEFQTH